MKFIVLVLSVSVLFSQTVSTGVTTSSSVSPPQGSFGASGLTEIQVTEQQAVLQYTCPTAAAATISVTDNSGLGVTVWDVNSSKFASSNIDTSRSNTITTNGGLTRQVEVGLRQAQQGTDGVMYSRSLQANTQHTFTTTCAGGSPVSINFNTLNIPIGNTAPTPAAFSSNGYANLMAPDIDWTNQNQVYIDPQTGVAMRPATWFGRFGHQATGLLGLSAYDPGAIWTNLYPNVLSGTTGTLATVSASTDPIYVSVNGNSINGQGFSNFSGPGLTDIRVTVCGSGTDASATNRTVGVTLQNHTASVIGNEIQFVLPQTTPACVTSASQSTWPSPPYGAWGVIPKKNLIFPWSTTANIVSGVVTNNGSAPNSNGIFNTDLVSGDKIWDTTNSTLYTVSSITDALHMTLQETPTRTGDTLTAANFGFRVRKTNATGNVSLSVKYDWAVDDFGRADSFNDGATRNCSSVASTISVDASGNPATPRTAYYCLFYSGTIWGTSLHAYFPDTGEVRLVGQLAINVSLLTTDLGIPANPWDPSTGNVFWVQGARASDARYILTKATYNGDGRLFANGQANYSGTPPTNDGHNTTCPGSSQMSGNICWIAAMTDNVETACNTYDPRFGRTGFFGIPAPATGVVGGEFVFAFYPNNQDSLAGFCNVSTTTGNVVSTQDSFGGTGGPVTTLGVRWSGSHTVDGRNAGNYFGMTNQTLYHNAAFGGPWGATVTKVCRATPGVPTTTTCTGGTVDSVSSLTSGCTNNDCYTCPSPSICSSPVTNTVLIQVNQQPESTHAATNESTQYPCPVNPSASCSSISNYQVGDLMVDLANTGGEYFQILAINQVSSTVIWLWVARAYVNQGSATGFSSHADQWSNAMAPTGSLIWFDATGSDTTARVDFPFARGAHNDAFGPGLATYSATSSNNSKYAAATTPTGLASQTVLTQNGYSSWQSNNACIGSGLVEEYPSIPIGSLTWYADFRSYQGGAASGGNVGTSNKAITLTHISNNLYTISSGCSLNIKRDPWEAWAGRYVLQDVSTSTTGNTILDTDTWKFCYALNANECRTGSSAGTIYIAAPFVYSTSNCWTDQYDTITPCVVPASPIGDWALQWDLSQNDSTGTNIRRLTKGFGSPSRLFTFWNWKPSPDVNWGFIPVTSANGTFSVDWSVKLPTWPSYDAVTRSSYVQVPVTATAGTFAEIRFGYEEYGATNAFYCTSRSDACITVASPTTANPFNFISDGHSGTSCPSGCTINVPGISGRMLWWQEFTSPTGSVWTAVRSPQQVAVP